MHGRSVVEVAALLNARLAGNCVYCDAWSFDASWVARLFDSAGFAQNFRMDTVRILLHEAAIAAWQTAREIVDGDHEPMVHRAAPDARRLQLTVLHAWAAAEA